MNTEEKANAYDRAIERAKKFIEENPLVRNLNTWIKETFPELKEDEDERIIDAIKHGLKCLGWEHINGIRIVDMLAWLEKQKDINALIQEASEKAYTEGMRVERKRWLEKQGDESVNIDIESMVSSYEHRVVSQCNGVRNNPIVNMCVSAFRHGVENTLEELNLKKLEKQGEQKASYTTIAETGNGGINALVTGEVSTNDYEEKPVDKTKPKFHRGEQNTNHKTMIVKFICKKDWHGIGDYYYGKIYNGYPCEKEQKGYDIYDDNHIPTFCDEDFINEYFNIITEEKARRAETCLE